MQTLAEKLGVRFGARARSTTASPYATLRVLGFPVVAAVTTFLSVHRDRRSVAPNDLPACVFVATFFAKESGNRLQLIDQADSNYELLTTPEQLKGKVPPVSLYTRDDGVGNQLAAELFPGHGSMYVLRGSTNAFLLHAVGCAAVTLDGGRYWRLSVPYHLFYRMADALPMGGC